MVVCLGEVLPGGGCGLFGLLEEKSLNLKIPEVGW